MVSIIIPVYNTEDYLADCLDSCFAQTYSNIEILAINDGSTDSSGVILDAYALKDPRIRVFHQKNQGVVAARNLGIKNSAGEWIMFVDSDDRISKNYIEVHMKSLLSSNADISISNYCELYPDQSIYKVCNIDVESIIDEQTLLRLLFREQLHWSLCAKIFKRDLLINSNSTNFVLGEDATLFIQALLKSKIIVLTPDVLYFYIQRSSSAVHKKNYPQIIDIFKFRIWILDYLHSRDVKIDIDGELFLLNGYIWCLLQGGVTYLTKEDHLIGSEYYLKVGDFLKIWQKIVFRLRKKTYVNKSVLLVLSKLQSYKKRLVRIIS